MFTARIEPAGGLPVVELETVTDAQTRFSTNAVGGFGSCDFTVPGLWPESQIPYLSTVKVLWGTRLVWEGRIEDRQFDLGKDTIRTSLSCFGFKRALDFTSIRRQWSTRAQEFQEFPGGDGASIFTGVTRTRNLGLTTGQFDTTDPTKSGVQIAGNGVSIATVTGQAAHWLTPIGLTWLTVRGTYVLSGTNTGAGKMVGRIVGYNAAGSVDADSGALTASSTLAMAMTAAASLRVLAYNAGAGALIPTSVDVFQFYDVRLFGSIIDEDVSGGFYGGSLLTNLVSLVPELAVGLIEAGSEFTLEQLDYGVRASALDILNAVAAFYAKEWAVWDDRRFYWKAPNLDEAQWIVSLADCSALTLKGSLDANTKTSYVLYTDAASGRLAEQSSTSTSRRNPFVKQAATRDELIQAPAVMTANTAAQLAARAIADHGTWPPVTGSISLPAEQLVASAVGSAQPAFTIRAGANISIPDLPKTDLFQRGRDGETLFHVVATEADVAGGTVTLQIEGQTRYLDVLMARLAAATRVLTG